MNKESFLEFYDVNYLADKYDNEPEKKRVSFLLYTEKLTLTFMTQGSVK